MDRIVKEIETALHSGETPQWGKVLLLCMRDNHISLHQHLDEHSRRSDWIRKLELSILSVIAIVLVLWLLAGRFPHIFGG